MRRWWGLLLFVSVTLGGWSSIDVAQVRSRLPLLPDTQIHIDPTRTATLTMIEHADFHPAAHEHIGYGYSPDFDVWVRLTLRNTSPHPRRLILEYANPLTTDIALYDGTTHALLAQEGLLHARPGRETLHPYFELTLEGNTTRTWYLKASSDITALVLQLNLWEPEAFFNHAIRVRSMLALFFGAMFVIIVYNLIIYFVTREISYLYYVLFFAAITLHQFNYRGVLAIALPPETIETVVKLAAFVVAAPVFFLMLFTRKVLDLAQYPRLNRPLNYLLVLYPSAILLAYLMKLYSLRAVLSIGMLFVLFVITLYALLRRNRQAPYLAAGWALFWVASLLMYLANTGLYDIFNTVPFFTELVLVIEALIFALSLAMMIRQINQERFETQQKYIALQEEKEHQLTQKVAERTRELDRSLQEKDLLLKELNHRVKNSIQTIVSFLRLQIDETRDTMTQRTLSNIENRILSINHLYALLNTRETLTHIDANTYFGLLADTIRNSFPRTDISITIDAQVQLPASEAVHCGFILNEALTNALQHAFVDDQTGQIRILLTQESDLYRMEIRDNGRGFDSTKRHDSLGLTIMESLATYQLKGTFNIRSDNGTSVIIQWKEKHHA